LARTVIWRCLVLGVALLEVGGAGGGGASRQQLDAKKLFVDLCAPCHGQAGAGNGPAASAFNPRPASFADPAFQAARADTQLVRVIAEGKPPMPAFGQQLSSAQIKALVTYLRQLAPQRPPKRPG